MRAIDKDTKLGHVLPAHFPISVVSYGEFFSPNSTTSRSAAPLISSHRAASPCQKPTLPDQPTLLELPSAAKPAPVDLKILLAKRRLTAAGARALPCN